MFTRYQCSVCRRIKDILKDEIRVVPNHCIITKGCLGYLFSLGNFPIQEPTLPVAGVDDWYPRGEIRTISPAEEEVENISLSCSLDGSLVIACKLTTQEFNDLEDFITIIFDQQRIENIQQTQFVFHIFNENTTILSGRDITGANLRFNQQHINEHKIFVTVNGVSKFSGTSFTLEENKITFNESLSIGDKVIISILQQTNTIERQITLQKNESFRGIGSTAWSNVRYLEIENSDLNDDNRQRLWLFTTSSSQLISLISGSRLKIKNISHNINLEDVRFLLAKSPYQFTDRYLNFYIDVIDLQQNNFNLFVQTVNSNRILFVLNQLKKEVYPPMRLLIVPMPPESNAGSSFLNISDEFETVHVAQIIEDTQQQLLKSNNVIGPII